jgi:protein-L-isoaspartate(D-aspartate) O-methyltransferase
MWVAAGPLYKSFVGDDTGADHARRARAALVMAVDRELGGVDARYARALLDVPRERFVRASDMPRAAEDVPLPLDDEGRSTVSAPHAYVLSFDLVRLAPGDRLLELGTGSGYGAALAAHVVGAEGRVFTIEFDPALAARARALLAAFAASPSVTVRQGDAMRTPMTWPDAWETANKILCTFAVDRIPEPWIARVREGAVLVAPVGPRERQHLVRVRRERGEIVTTVHAAVRYVPNRSA